MTAPRPSPARPVRATRVTPPQHAPLVSASRRSPRALNLLSVLLLAAAGTAAFFGNRAVQLERALVESESLLNKSVARLAERDEALAALLDAERDLVVTHVVSDTLPHGMSVYWNRADGRTIVSAFDLPALSRTRVYAVWLVDSVNARLAATFTPNERGRAISRQFLLPPSSAPITTVRLTIESAATGTVPAEALLEGTVIPP